MLEPVQILNVVGAASTNSIALDLANSQSFSISVNFTGSDVAGSLKLQARNIESQDWIDVTGSTQAVTSSTSHLYNVTQAQYKYVRLSWTYTSGTGNIVAYYLVKETVISGA